MCSSDLAHLNRYGNVRVGDRIEAGTIIGYAGNTGNARGGAVHLHYGIYRNGRAQNPYPRLAAGARLAAGTRQAAPGTARTRATDAAPAPRTIPVAAVLNVVLGRLAQG